MSDQQHAAASATAGLHGAMLCDTDVRERQISTMSSVDFQSLLALSNSFYFLYKLRKFLRDLAEMNKHALILHHDLHTEQNL